MLKDHQKPHVVTRYDGNLASLFASIHSLFIKTAMQKQTLINN